MKDQRNGALGFAVRFVKNVRLVNFISSLYTAPVQVDDCYSQRFEHTYSLSLLMSIISEITQTHYQTFKLFQTQQTVLKSAKNITFLIYSNWTESLSEIKKNAPIIHYVFF